MAGNPGDRSDIAAKGGLHRTIPNASSAGSVTTGTTTLDLGAFGAGGIDLRGRWVFLTARGGDVTIRRYTGSPPTLTAGVGFTILDGTTEEVFVDPEGATNLAVIGSAACSLDADVDTEIG